MALLFGSLTGVARAGLVLRYTSEAPDYPAETPTIPKDSPEYLGVREDYAGGYDKPVISMSKLDSDQDGALIVITTQGKWDTSDFKLKFEDRGERDAMLSRLELAMKDKKHDRVLHVNLKRVHQMNDESPLVYGRDFSFHRDVKPQDASLSGAPSAASGQWVRGSRTPCPQIAKPLVVVPPVKGLDPYI